MQFLPNALTRQFGRQILQVQKNSPVILFSAGVVGVIATVVLSSRTSLKLEEKLEQIDNDKTVAKIRYDEGANSEYTEKQYHKDLRKIQVSGALQITRMYAPAAGIGLVSIACLTGSHVILTNRNMALTAAYAALDRGFREYRQRVTDEVGADRERELRYGSENAKVMTTTDDGKTQMVTRHVPSVHGTSPYARFFDQLTPNWSKTPEYNLVFLRCQQNYANDLLRARGHLFLNEVYDMLGLDRSKAGAVVGWVIGKEGDNFVDFGLYDGDNPRARDFVNGREGAILLDFNVDGVIYDKI